jgi:hypothetical protein
MKQCWYYEAGKSLEENKKSAEVKIKERAEKKKKEKEAAKKEKETPKKNDGQGSTAARMTPLLYIKALLCRFPLKLNTPECVTSRN